MVHPGIQGQAVAWLCKEIFTMANEKTKERIKELVRGMPGTYHHLKMMLQDLFPVVPGTGIDASWRTMFGTSVGVLFKQYGTQGVFHYDFMCSGVDGLCTCSVTSYCNGQFGSMSEGVTVPGYTKEAVAAAVDLLRRHEEERKALRHFGEDA